MEKIELNLDKLAIVVSTDLNLPMDRNDPINQIIEKAEGRILKMFYTLDGLCIALCEGKDEKSS